MLNKEIYLTEEEQIRLKEIVRKGVHNAHVITRDRVLLMLDRTGKTDHVRYKRTAEYAQISVQAVFEYAYSCVFLQSVLSGRSFPFNTKT